MYNDCGKPSILESTIHKSLVLIYENMSTHELMVTCCGKLLHFCIKRVIAIPIIFALRLVLILLKKFQFCQVYIQRHLELEDMLCLWVSPITRGYVYVSKIIM